MADEPHGPPDPDRRRVVRQVGGWVIFSGATGAAATIGACGRTPLGEPFDFFPTGSIPTSIPTTNPTATGSVTPIAPCGCPQVPGVSTGINVADLPAVGYYAYNAGLSIFVCRDAIGFYAMTSICTHAACNMGSMAQNTDYANLAGGFGCDCHGSTFDSNGGASAGNPPPGTNDLIHYRLGVDTNGDIYVDITSPFADPSCRCDASGNEV